MKSPRRLVPLEDSPPDAELCRSLLGRDGQHGDITLARNAAEFRAAIAQGGFDAILGDSSSHQDSLIEKRSKFL